jgi:hypothetical protein
MGIQEAQHGVPRVTILGRVDVSDVVGGFWAAHVEHTSPVPGTTYSQNTTERCYDIAAKVSTLLHTNVMLQLSWLPTYNTIGTLMCETATGAGAHDRSVPTTNLATYIPSRRRASRVLSLGGQHHA